LKITSWFTKPFPFYETYRQKLIIPLFFGIFIMLFLILFNPSHNTDFVWKQFFKVFAYGLITFSVMSICNVIFPLVFPQFFNSEKWTVLRMIIFLTLTMIFIGLVNGVFGFLFDNPDNNDRLTTFLVAVMARTLTIGVLPTIMFIFYIEKSFYKKHRQVALETIEKLKNSRNGKIDNPDNIDILKLTPSGSRIKVEIAYGELFCIKAEENYCICFFKRNEHLEKIMVRSTLKQLEQELTKNGRIIRCHKSYIINLDNVSDITGNARGYIFTIDGLYFNIPGSRNLPKTIVLHDSFPFIT